MEELIAGHPAVAECVVKGIDDELRGTGTGGICCTKGWCRNVTGANGEGIG